MINLIRKSNLCVSGTVILNSSRGLALTPVCEFRAGDSSWVRRLSLPTVRGKLLKDSNFVDPEMDPNELDTDAGHLERSYEEYISEVKDEKKALRKILTKKSMYKRPKEPNMLTFNEREHIKFLHKSDPNEWSVERLSESFSAQPHAIRKILKGKWSPKSLEVIKQKDAEVMKNWEKLKKNELQASPEFLNHLQKFINKHDNLKAQLENPKFFPEVEGPKKISWGDGPLTGLLTKYEKDIERLQSRHLKKVGLIQGGDAGETAVALSGKYVSTIGEDIKMETEIREMKDDSFVLGKPQLRGKAMTLDDLKRDLLEKTENGRKPLTKYEKAVLGITLGDARQTEELVVKEKTNQSQNTLRSGRQPEELVVKDETNHSRNYGINESDENKEIKPSALISNYSKISIYKYDKSGKKGMKETTQFEDDEESDEKLIEYNEKHITKETDVGSLLRRLRGEEDPVTKEKEPEVKQKKKANVQYYGTEKDAEMVNRDNELLAGTGFWASGTKPRKISETAGTMETRGTNTKTSPHLSPSLKTYFTYAYPESIKIPKDKWVKGMTYRVNDCYYDDDGEFLYRVPGITED